METYLVVALAEALEEGAVVNRRAWPAHVTLASNFGVSAPLHNVVSAVRSVGIADEPLAVDFVGADLFGPQRDIPVLLVRSERARILHERLADQLETLAGFAAEVPGYWREGYRAHLTVVPDVEYVVGGSAALTHVAVARLSAGLATVEAIWALPVGSAGGF